MDKWDDRMAQIHMSILRHFVFCFILEDFLFHAWTEVASGGAATRFDGMVTNGAMFPLV